MTCGPRWPRCRGELELAEDPATAMDELRAAVRRAHADAVRLGDLAAGLLDLAAVGADGRALARSSVRADLLVESVVRRLEPVARERGVSIVRTVPGRLIRVDRIRLEQALANLVLNAITHGPAGAEVSIAARFDDRPGSGPGPGQGRPPGSGPGRAATDLTIEVDDRGPGIAPGLEERIFEPFERGEAVHAPGSGLGLATAAAAVRAHHGTIGYLPRPGGGARFWIRLPV